MASTLKLRKIGNSLGVVLPKDVLARLGAREGDALVVAENENGLSLRRADADYETHMRKVEDLMARYPKTLRALAE